MQVGERGFLGIFDVALQIEQAIAAARQHRRQVVVIVILAQTAAIGDHGAIKQRSVSVFRGFELADEVGELLNLIAIDTYAFVDLLFVAAAMGQAVVRVGNAKLSGGAVLGL